MRSKEVDLAISSLFHLQHINTYLDLTKDKIQITSEIMIDWSKSTDTVLSYIEELEKQIPTPSNEVPVEYQTFVFVDKRDAVMKSEIRDKIKELEEYQKQVESRMKEKYSERDTLLQVIGGIYYLKSIIGE